MKAVKLSGSIRSGVGKKNAASVRAEGNVPGIIYGGDKQIPIQINEIDLSKVVFTPKVYQYEIDVDGTVYRAIMKEIQQHPVTDRVIHVDFMEIVPGKEVKLKIPIKLVGNALGVRNGGRLSAPNRSIMIQGNPDNFPDEVVVDIDKLKIGQSIKVGDLNEPKIKILANDDVLLASIKMSRGAVLTEEEEEAEAAEAAAAAAEGGEGAPAEGGGEDSKE